MIVERIARGEPLEQTLTELCVMVEDRFPGAFCTVLTVDRSAGVLRHSASPSLPREFAEQVDGLPVGEGMGACGTSAARGLMTIVSDLGNDPMMADFLDIAQRFEIGAVWSYPLLASTGQVLGTFAVYRGHVHEPADDEIRFVAHAGNLAALAIDRALVEAAVHTATDLDSLTGLPNRSRFLELANGELRRHQGRLGVMLIEIDRFAQIYDSLGYLDGDNLLVEVARRVRTVIGEVGTISRFGLNVFTAMIPDTELPLLEALAEAVLSEIRQPLEIGGVELILTVSIGIATGDRKSDAFTLVRDADTAMRAARAEGPGHHHPYDRKLRVETVTRLRTEQELRRGIQLRQFVMHYQPILDLRDHRWTGVEALVRWKHPRRGLIAPDAFIPLAEETGLIVPLGELVFEMVIAQAHGWALSLPDLRFSVNASVVQLAHPSIATVVERMLDDAGLEPRALMLEVTETALMQQLEMTRQSLERLAADGVAVLIDDFGTGYSSIARLGELPISGLKIDRRFVKGLGSDPQAAPVLKAISDLARAHRLSVVVEGIEQPSALEAVMALGCDYAQGYHLGRPMPADQAFELLAGPVPDTTAIA